MDPQTEQELPEIKSIITHPGGAHKDEFLACAVILHFYPVEIYRRDPEETELLDPEAAVIDIGHQHEPMLSNFDHHQFPKDYPATCSLSLILRHFGLYEDAQKFCEWLPTLEWFDSKGAISTSKWLDTSFENIRKLNSPIDVSLLKWFASENHWEPGDIVWEILRKLGSDLVLYLQNMHARMEFIEQHSEIWELPTDEYAEPIRMLFLPRTDPLPKDPSLGLSLFMNDSKIALQGLIYPDRRGEGYGLSRYNDNALLDFTQISEEPDVHFSHARGFLAKTNVSDPSRLKELVGKSIVPSKS